MAEAVARIFRKDLIRKMISGVKREAMQLSGERPFLDMRRASGVAGEWREHLECLRVGHGAEYQGCGARSHGPEGKNHWAIKVLREI